MNSRKSKIFKSITLSFNILLFLTLSLFLLTNFSSFEIKSQELKSFIIYGLIIFPLIPIIWSIIRFNNLRKIILNNLIPILVLIAVVLIGPLKLFFQTSVYKTQSIHYININNPNKKVEFQIQDMGAFGYNKRDVEVTHYFGLFMKINHILQVHYDTSKWQKVDINLNELNLKSP